MMNWRVLIQYVRWYLSPRYRRAARKRMFEYTLKQSGFSRAEAKKIVRLYDEVFEK